VAYDSCGRGDAAVVVTYETASALAAWLDPKMGLAPWHSPGWHYSGLSLPLQILVGPCVSMGRSAL